MQFAIRKNSLPILSLAGLLAAGAGFTGCQSDDATGADSDALLVLTSPRGGGPYKVGQTLQIKWTTPKTDPNLPVEQINVRFSADSGKLWRSLAGEAITRQHPEWGNMAWKIPDTLSFSGLKVPLAGKKNCKLALETYDIIDPAKQKTDTVSFDIIAATP
jgi:hypothetical protein